MMRFALLVAIAACGSKNPPDPDAGTVDATTPPVTECTATTFEEDCPPRACEVPVGCTDDGMCVYGPFECGEVGRTCPAERCESSGTGDAIVNRCVLIPDAPCGEGRVCMGELCVAPATGLSLDGSLHVARIDAASDGLELHGDLSFTPRAAGPRQNGTVRLTGGLTLSGGTNR